MESRKSSRQDHTMRAPYERIPVRPTAPADLGTEFLACPQCHRIVLADATREWIVAQKSQHCGVCHLWFEFDPGTA